MCLLQAHVLIKGQACSIVGRICMNMMMVDVSKISNPTVGEVVTLIGKDKKEEITAEQIAQWAQTIQYEIVSKLNPKIPRILVRKK